MICTTSSERVKNKHSESQFSLTSLNQSHHDMKLTQKEGLNFLYRNMFKISRVIDGLTGVVGESPGVFGTVPVGEIWSGRLGIYKLTGKGRNSFDSQRNIVQSLLNFTCVFNKVNYRFKMLLVQRQMLLSYSLNKYWVLKYLIKSASNTYDREYVKKH